MHDHRKAVKVKTGILVNRSGRFQILGLRMIRAFIRDLTDSRKGRTYSIDKPSFLKPKEVVIPSHGGFN